VALFLGLSSPHTGLLNFLDLETKDLGASAPMFPAPPGFYKVFLREHFLYEVVHTILYLNWISRMGAISCGDRNGKTEVKYREVFHSVLWENTGPRCGRYRQAAGFRRPHRKGC